MFRNWRSIFNGDGGPLDARIPIYSFDGRDVLADPFWSVHLIDSLLVSLCLFLLFFIFSAMLIYSVIYPSGLRRVSGMAPPAGASEWWTNTVRRGERTTCLSWASRRAWPQVCSWASRRGAAPTSTLFFASRPTKTFNPLAPVPLNQGTHPSQRKRSTLGEKDLSVFQREGRRFQHICGAMCSILCFLKQRIIFNTFFHKGDVHTFFSPFSADITLCCWRREKIVKRQ